jgi:hypothetical protein
MAAKVVQITMMSARCCSWEYSAASLPDVDADQPPEDFAPNHELRESIVNLIAVKVGSGHPP